MQLRQMFSVHVSQKHEKENAVNLWSGCIQNAALHSFMPF